jgi:hypothetical protein
MISARRTNKRMEWALNRIRERVALKLGMINKDGYLPMTEPPNELEELDMLQQELPQIEMMLTQPPSPETEALRSQAQTKYQRWIELSLKLRGNNGQAPS